MAHMLKQRYLILSKLGQGGMGAVYKAEDTSLGNRLVAIKEMSQRGLDPQEIFSASQAFKQEADMLAGLHHPHLPSIHEHFEEAGRWYLVMSFIEGETLESYVQTRGDNLPIPEVLDIGMQLCTVLDYLHNRQPSIIFRDLKPLNIMRTPDGHLYLIDFGIARHFKVGQSGDTRIGYTPGYAAPEQYGLAQTTPRSDIYSLGATLHQLLSGNHPSRTPFLFAPLRLQGYPNASDLEKLILQMVEMDAKNRPARVTDVKKALQDIAIQKITHPLQSGDSLTFISPHRPPPNITRTIPAQPVAPESYKQPMMNPIPPYTPPVYTRTEPFAKKPPIYAPEFSKVKVQKGSKIIYPRIALMLAIILIIPVLFLVVIPELAHSGSSKSLPGPLLDTLVGLLILSLLLYYVAWVWTIVYAARRGQKGWLIGLIIGLDPWPFGLLVLIYLLFNPQGS